MFGIMKRRGRSIQWRRGNFTFLQRNDLVLMNKVCLVDGTGEEDCEVDWCITCRDIIILDYLVLLLVVKFITCPDIIVLVIQVLLLDMILSTIKQERTILLYLLTLLSLLLSLCFLLSCFYFPLLIAIPLLISDCPQILCQIISSFWFPDNVGYKFLP